jgi:hypothetical protein
MRQVSIRKQERDRSNVGDMGNLAQPVGKDMSNVATMSGKSVSREHKERQGINTETGEGQWAAPGMPGYWHV